MHGLNITELLDEIIKKFQELKKISKDSEIDRILKDYTVLDAEAEAEIEGGEEGIKGKTIPSISILGQPNFGKSTLFNNIINEE